MQFIYEEIKPIKIAVTINKDKFTPNNLFVKNSL